MVHTLYSLGVAKIFRFTCTFFWSIPTYSITLSRSFSEKNDRYPTQNAVLCLPLNNSTSILCSNT